MVGRVKVDEGVRCKMHAGLGRPDLAVMGEPRFDRHTKVAGEHKPEPPHFCT